MGPIAGSRIDDSQAALRPSLEVAAHEQDLAYMDRALRLAEQGRGRTGPNPMVGAVVVDGEGVVVGAGYHRRAGEPHAEVHALAAAGRRAEGATLYCSLEPCAHTGRTGPCTERIIAAGIRRVVAAVEDPNPQVAGRGIGYLRERGLAVSVGCRQEEAIRLNESFFSVMRRQRPSIILKVATSLDGRIAAVAGCSTRLTGPTADRRTHLLRAEVDAIAVGSGTVLADDPLLTVRGVYRERPLLRVVFDRRLRVAPTARVFTTIAQGPILIMTAAATLRSMPDRVRDLVAAGAGIEVLDTPDLSAGMRRLAAMEVSSVLLEGGAQLHAAALREGIVDRVHLYVTPRVLGRAGVPWVSQTDLSIPGLQTPHVRLLGEDVLIEGHVHRID